MENGTNACYFNNSAHGEDNYTTRILGSHSVLDAVFDGVSTVVSDNGDIVAGQGSIASLVTKTDLSNAEISKPIDVKNLLARVNNNLHATFNEKALTTATVALKIKDRLYVINVGDSPAYLFREGNVMELTTMDYIENHPAAISQAIGIRDELNFHIRRINLKPGDRIILATDGITDNIYPDELYARVIKDTQDPRIAVSRLESLLAFKKFRDEGRLYNDFKTDDQTAIIRFF